MADLNAQFPNLETLFQNMPAFAALQAGDQARLANQNNRSLQDAFSAEEAHKAQERPLELEQKQATIGSTNSTAAYNNALARGSNLKSDELEQTMPGDVEATNAVNKGKVSASQLAQMENEGQMYGQMAARLKSIPPMFRPAAVKQMMGNRLTQGPGLDELLASDVHNLPAHFEALARQSFANTNAARTEAMKEGSAMARTKEATRSAEKINTDNINAGKFVKAPRGGAGALTREQIIDKEGNPLKKYTLLVSAAEEAEQEGDTEGALKFAKRAMAIKGIAEQAVAAGGGGSQVVVQQPGGRPTLAPKSGAGTQLPAPTQAASQPAAAPQQYSKGQSYKGRTGTFMYNGGDPKDPKNWTKAP